MKVDIEYNQETMTIEIPDGNLLDVIAPDYAEQPITADTFQQRLVETERDRTMISFLEGIRERDENLLLILKEICTLFDDFSPKWNYCAVPAQPSNGIYKHFHS